ncbi:hypothetical protein K435DRAFT_606101, partial [Dendrothele bispora CBS 962.96]
TQRMSGTKRPLIYQVIPLMDKINTMLEDFFDDTTKEDSIRFAIKAGVKILDKYYASTDDSLIYRAAMSIYEPKVENKYFERNKWPQVWVDAAKETL